MGASDIRTQPGARSEKNMSDEMQSDIDRLNKERKEKRRSYFEAQQQKQQPTGVADDTGNSDGALLAAAAANGDLITARKVIEQNPKSLNSWGPDGTTPLCAAVMWGHVEFVKLLISAGADPNVRNKGSAQWGPLHAAALQEHGKLCMFLLERGADPSMQDTMGVTPSDYASVSEPVWPLFAARGCTRTIKDELIAKGVIRKVSEALEQELQTQDLGGRRGLIPEISRPGSAYVVSQEYPPRPGSSFGNRQQCQQIDILAEEDDSTAACTGSLRTLGI